MGDLVLVHIMDTHQTMVLEVMVVMGVERPVTVQVQLLPVVQVYKVSVEEIQAVVVTIQVVVVELGVKVPTDLTNQMVEKEY